MDRPLISQSGDGKELSDLLRAALGIPAAVRWFEVRFALGEVVTVKCEYIATEQPEPPPGPDDEDPAAAPRQQHGSLDDD